MRESVISSIERFIENRAPNLKSLSLSWFGGEPLAASDIVLRISEFSKHLCNQHSVNFGGVITTNGYHLDFDLFSKLVNLNQNHLQISLDGWGSIHDRTRKLANGKGTFQRIWQNLLELRNFGGEFGVVLRVHLTNKNFDGVQKLCSMIVENFGKDPRFSVNLQDVRPLGGASANVERIDPLKFEGMASALHEILNNMKKDHAKVSSSDNTRENLNRMAAEDQAYICYASKPNSILIRSDGSIGKCTVHLSSDHNKIGRLKSDGKLEIDQSKSLKWLRGFANGDLETLACPAKQISPSGMNSS